MPQRMPGSDAARTDRALTATGTVGLAQRGIRQPTNAQQRSPARASDVSDVRLSDDEFARLPIGPDDEDRTCPG
jgi:hypothetical protein